MGQRTRPRRNPRRARGTLKDGERRQLARVSRHADDPRSRPAPADRALALCDGGSRGNPGTAAAAAVLLSPAGEIVDQRAELIGQASAAAAEYRAILLGLNLARAYGADRLEVRSDSQLAIAALRAGTPVAPELRAVVEAVRAAALAFSAVRWSWHGRAQNELADALVRALLWP